VYQPPSCACSKRCTLLLLRSCFHTCHMMRAHPRITHGILCMCQVACAARALIAWPLQVLKLLKLSLLGQKSLKCS
jgi:hypothetical protein